MIRNWIDKIIGNWERKLLPVNRIEIDAERMLKNFDEVKKKSGTEVWPVLKANAYGGGLEQVAKILRARKYRYAVVDSYYEALRIWRVSRQKILLIGSLQPSNYSKINWRRAALMVSDISQIWDLVTLGKKVKIHLKINTGMNRQGIEVEEILEALKVIAGSENIELEGLMSHLADTNDSVWTKDQEEKFAEAIDIVKRTGFKPRYYHLAASGGIGKIAIKELNAVRVGVDLYKGAIRLVSKIVKVRQVAVGERISYSGTYKFKKGSWVGVIPVGYYEGLDRRLSNKGYIKYNGEYYPMVGNICMNMCLVNFGEIKPNLYDEVEVIGQSGQNSIEEMAKIVGTIPYEVMVKLNESVRREIA
jgi:alanine racemase